MDLSILHISDLHRDPSHDITNLALLRSLQGDCDRYQVEEIPIPLPEIVVVSGDIVQGIPADAPDPNNILSQQYKQAEEFLCLTCRSLLCWGSESCYYRSGQPRH